MRVVAPGNALQFRELIDHARLQIVFRQLRCALRLHGVGTHLRRDGFGQCRHARHLVGHAAEFGLIGDGVQAIAHRRQALLQIFIEEEFGIGKARANHALIAFADFRRRFRFDIGNADEVLGQPALRIQHREELLVALHGFDQRFLRHTQELALECASHCHRPFVEAHHLLQIVVGDARTATGGVGGSFDFRQHTVAALVRVHQYMRGAQGVDVVAGAGNPHRAFVHEAMTTAHAARADAQHRDVHDLIAQQRHQPMQRPRKPVAVRAPAHRLGDRHRRHRLGQHVLQQRTGGRAGRGGAMHEALALAVGGFFQRRPVHSGLGGKALQCLGRLAVGIQRDVQIRAQHFRRLRRLLSGHTRQQHGQTARRIQRLGQCAVNADTALVQRGDHAIEQRLRQTGQCLDRKFFGAQFDQ